MEMKGVIFSYDAMMGAIIIITLFSGIMLLGSSNDSLHAGHAQLFSNASDAALQEYLQGKTANDTTTNIQANCIDMYRYSKAKNKVTIEVTKCKP